MDTWSALLLCHPSTKIQMKEDAAFSHGVQPPLYLPTFKGSVAERHVENLKIIRTVGAKRYIEASRELTVEETLFRQKVYNFYCGPGKLPPLNLNSLEIRFIGLRIGKSREFLHGSEKVSFLKFDLMLTTVDVIPFPFTLVKYPLSRPDG